MHRLLIVFSIVLILVLSAGIYYFYFRTAAPSIGLDISRPSEATIGVPFPVSVSFSNYSDKILTDVRLSVTLPDGLSYAGEAQDQRVREASIGDVGPGSIQKQDFSILAVKDPQTLKRIEAKVNYKVASDSRVGFEVRAEADVPIGQPAVSLSFSLPEKVLSGENFSVTLNYENVSGKDYPNLRIRIDSPPMFQLKRAEPEAPEGTTNQWDFGTVKAGEKGTIVLSGVAAGPEQSILNFSASLLANILGEKYALSTQTASVAIAASSLSLSVTVNGEKEYVAELGKDLLYVFRYRNNSNATLENITVRAALTGELYDFASVQTSASLNSLTNTFTWNAANTPSLAKLEPGDEGSVSLPIKTKSKFPIARLGDKNFVLKVSAQAESPTVPSGVAADKTIALADIENKVKGAIEVVSKVLFRDASSGVLNKGPYPPKVNQPTQYSVHWQVTNYGTNVSGAVVRAFINSGARFTGITKSTVDAMPSYNSASGEVVWQVGNIAATKGVVTPPVEAIFQIEYTPSVNQAGQSVQLLGDTRIEAHDDFTDELLTNTARAVSTDLPDDPTIREGDRRVMQ